MFKNFILFIFCFVGLILGASTAVFAGTALNVPAVLQGWLPLLGSGAVGIFFILITLIPAIRNVGFQFQDAVLEFNKFIAKWQSVLLVGEIKQDFMKVLMKFDIALESLAVIMGKVGAKKLQTFLSDIIKQEWYTSK